MGDHTAGPGGVDGDGDDTPEELSEQVDSIVSLITEVEITIDGVAVADTEQYRVVSGGVPLDTPEDDLWTYFGWPGPWTFGQFGGFALFINPLPPGEHVIHATAGLPAIDLTFEITYNITVEPRN